MKRLTQRLTHGLWVLPVFLGAGLLPVQAQAPGPLCPAALPEAIATITERPEWRRSRWGLLIAPQDGGATLYAREAEALFVPASATKLLTLAAVLHRLGPDFRLRTPVHGLGEPPILSRLQVSGRGDPSLTTEQLQALAARLRAQGVERVRELVVTDGYFQQVPRHPTWELEDILFYFATAVNSAILNENTVALTLYPQAVGEPLRAEWGDRLAGQQWQLENWTVTAPPSTARRFEAANVLGQPVLQLRGELAADADPAELFIAVLDPARYFRDTLQASLEAVGITVEAATVAPENPEPQGRLLTHLESPPLSELLRATQQPSSNLRAEALLQTLGMATEQPTAALEALTAALAELGVDPTSYRLRDGSGLSRHNMVSPAAVVATLQGLARSPTFATYRASLPVGGVSGTLRQRFRDTPLEGLVVAKTGTMTGVSTLSGYLDPATYEPLVFSIMVNRSDRPIAEQRAAIDEIVLLLGRLQACSEP